MFFTQAQAEAIADALGETTIGLTGSEIGHLFRLCGMSDPAAQATKRHRLLAAFAASQNTRGDRTAVLAFVRHSMKPERWLRDPARYEPLRANLNRALAFAGLACDAAGALAAVEQVQTIAQAERRAEDLRADMMRRGVHPDVVRCCRPELLADDYFHAVLEAVKSVADKLRTRTGLLDDGAALVDRALGGEPPMLVLLHLCAAGLVGYKPWHDETATSTPGTAKSVFQRPAVHRRGDPMGGAMVPDVPDQLP